VFFKSEDSFKEPLAESENFTEKQLLMTLNGPWNVSFDTIMGGPSSIVFDDLADWSGRPEDGIKYYSGEALYSKSFSLPESLINDKSKDIYLDLGAVKNIASVTLNGINLGVVWTSPWRINISKTVRVNDNRLEIEVANLWINRLIGDESKPWDGIENGKWPDWVLDGTDRPSNRFTFTTYRYYKKDDPLSESGLLGPVSIMIGNKSLLQANE
jgi:hypothetical protein